MSWNNDLKNAKSQKKDEFYTQLSVIEDELKHYKEHFKWKIVYCNCDDPYESNFFKYFAMNFNFLWLKKLIATSYSPSPIAHTQLNIFWDKKSYKIEINEVYDVNCDGAEDLADVKYLLENGKWKNKVSILEWDWDFRSEECLEILKKVDIVVTNPPFSLFREYVAQLVKYNKKFLIIWNVNSLTYKDIFSLVKNNKLWLWQSIHSWDREFKVPDDYPLTASWFRIDEKGNKYIRVKWVRWFTNLDYKERHDGLILYKKYEPNEYPFFENYEWINIDKTTSIPYDYNWIMWVPITFMDKYSPEQFEIVALWIVWSCEFTKNREMFILDKKWERTTKKTFNAKWTLYRKHLKTDKKPAAFQDVETWELYQSIYARILIRRKK